MSTATANSKAQQALKLVWDGTFPIDPKAIAEKLRIISKNSSEKTSIKVQGAFLDGYSGQAELKEDDEERHYLCSYNFLEADYRQRFTIAHELGHVLMGHVTKTNAPHRDKDFNPDGNWNEVDANAFAAELLMPEKYVREAVEKLNDISSLADMFGVSPTAIRYRLKKLKIL